jgi:cell division septation protein DedD
MFVFGKEKNKFVENKLVEKKPYIELSRKKAFLWLAGIFFACCWMFVLGVLVEREIAPLRFNLGNSRQNLQEELRIASEKEKEGKNHTETYSSGKPSVDGKQNLGFYEDLKSTKETAESIKMGEGQINESPLKEQPPAREPEPVKPVKAEEKTVPEPPPAVSLPDKVSGPVFTIQTASGKEKKSAEKTVKTLIGKGYPAYVVVSEIPEKGTWYRVRIGEFRERKEAEKLLSRLGKDKIKGIIVTKGQ